MVKLLILKVILYYSHLHFSVYGKFEQRKVAEAAAIGALIKSSSHATSG
jgi:hypothetical protein